MFSLLSGLAFLVGSFLFLKLGTFCWERSHLPPGPFPIPLLGNLWQLSFRLHPETLIQLAQTHGNVFTVWVGPTPVVVLNGFQAVKEALISNSEQFSGRPLTPLFQDLFGERGVICSNGHTWRQQRRFCLTTLRGLGLGKPALEAQLQEEAAELAEAFHRERGKDWGGAGLSHTLRAPTQVHIPAEEAEPCHICLRLGTCPPSTPKTSRTSNICTPLKMCPDPHPFPHGRPFNPQVPIVRSTARVIGALVFGHRFLSEEPIFQELIQAINFGLAFVSTTWRRIILGSPEERQPWVAYVTIDFGVYFGALRTALSCPELGPKWALGGTLSPQLYDMFPWALRHLPGPHQEIFRYQEALQGFICHEIIRCKLRTPEAPKNFISCYLTQITKVPLLENRYGRTDGTRTVRVYPKNPTPITGVVKRDTGVLIQDYSGDTISLVTIETQFALPEVTGPTTHRNPFSKDQYDSVGVSSTSSSTCVTTRDGVNRRYFWLSLMGCGHGRRYSTSRSRHNTVTRDTRSRTVPSTGTYRGTGGVTDVCREKDGSCR
ncbi:Hypothetical predicted protein [Marmota monax]|uniref:Uncharacterized protein n=1 Tax=Marmota monax TaxID=9995 RepID=A0A5E4B4Q6_MARMO|nr:Hypothetical predicted protein [Marmota monax]